MRHHRLEAAVLKSFQTLLPPESAHAAALLALRLGWVPRIGEAGRAAPVVAMGMPWRNRLILAAGFDKYGLTLPGVSKLGFAGIEIGTVTRYPQSGNRKPRLFRLPQQRALVNRMGFNNPGVAVVAKRLRRWRLRRWRLSKNNADIPFRIGANIGPNRECGDLAGDLNEVIVRLAPWVDYIMLNISSPNTPGLRDLQTTGHLSHLLDTLTLPPGMPLLLKLSPDLTELAELVVWAGSHPAVSGLCLTNTTIRRPSGTEWPPALAQGGLSGEPLHPLAVASVRQCRAVGFTKTVIGSGGIDSVTKMRNFIENGAELVQLYTGLVYKGIRLARQLLGETDQEPATPLVAEKNGYQKRSTSV